MAVVVAVCREIKMKHQQDVGVCVCVCVCFFFRIELSTNMNDKAEHEKKESLCCVAANPICNKQTINQSINRVLHKQIICCFSETTKESTMEAKGFC